MKTVEATASEGMSAVLDRFSWHTLFTALAADGIAYGFGLYSHGALLIALSKHFSASRFEISLAFSISTLVTGMSSLAIGPILDRRPLKPIMVMGALLFSTGFCLASYARSLFLYYLVFGVFIGAGCATVSQSASAKLVANHFVTQRGRVLALASIGVSLAGVIMPIVSTWLVHRMDVTKVYLLYGVAALCILLPLMLSIEPGLDAAPAATASLRPAPSRGYRELAGTLLFWKMVIVFGLSFTVIVVILVHTLPRIVDSGVGSTYAAYAGSAIALLGIPAKLLLSRHADSGRLFLLFSTSIGMQIVGLGVFVTSSGYAANMVGSFLFGLGMGAVQPSLAIFVGALFGRARVGTVMGLLAPFMYGIQFVGVPLAGHLFDRYGNYSVALWLCIGAYTLVLITVASMRADLRASFAR